MSETVQETPTTRQTHEEVLMEGKHACAFVNWDWICTNLYKLKKFVVKH